MTSCFAECIWCKILRGMADSNRAAHLPKWQKGQSGNPNGGSRAHRFARALRELSADGEGRELAEFMWAVVRADVEKLKAILPPEMDTPEFSLEALKAAMPEIKERVAMAKDLRAAMNGKDPEVVDGDSTMAGQSDEEILKQLLDALPEDVKARALRHLVQQTQPSGVTQ